MATTRRLVRLLGLLALLNCSWGAEPPLVRVYPGPAPAIDGKLDDPCWSTATMASPFILARERVLPVEQTRLMLSHDRDRLYVAFLCQAADPEKIFVGDGDPALNDRVELTLQWRGGERATILVDAAGRLRCSEGTRDVKAAVGRLPRAYTVELSLPRPPKAADVQFIARRFNEVTAEESAWGAPDAMAIAELAAAQGPVVKVGSVGRFFRPNNVVPVEVANPTPAYQTVRASVVAPDTSSITPSLLRLDAKQTLAVQVRFQATDVQDAGLQLLVDDPQGQPVYLRSPAIRTPPGRAPGRRALDVIPHPRSVDLLRTDEPFLLDARCRIVIGQRDNEIEGRAAGLLQREIQEICGLDLPIERGEYFLSYPCIVVGTARTTLLAARVAEAFDLEFPFGKQGGGPKRAAAPYVPLGEPLAEEPLQKPAQSARHQGGVRAPEQAYILGVRSNLIGVAALHDTGTLYGVQTLIQILASAQRDQTDLIVPAMHVSDWPALPLRGWLWAGSRPDITFMFPAFLRFKLNVVSEVPGADLASARSNGVYLARLQLPPSPLVAAEPQPPLLFVTPSDDMPRPLRHSLRLPVAVEEETVKPPTAAPEAPKLARPAPRASSDLQHGRSSRAPYGLGTFRPPPPEPLSPPEDFEKPKPVAAAWVHGDPRALSDAARAAAARTDLVGLFGGLHERSTLLPPSWAEIVAAAAYGWAPEAPVPDLTGETFCRSFFGSAEVAEARDLLERAVASLPRSVAVADLLDPTRPLPSPPRPDLPNLVRLAKEKAHTARRSRQVAAVLAQAADRVLAASNNVVAMLRARELYAQAAELHRGGRWADAAERIDDLAKCLTDARAQLIAVLGEPAARLDDARLLASAAVTARQIARQVAEGAPLPDAEPFWRRLKGQTP